MKFSAKELSITGIMIAFVFLATAFLILPLPASAGYYHLGDTMVLLSGYVLGPVLGSIAAMLGSGLADFSAGFAVYIPATIVIKGLMAFLASKLRGRNSVILYIIIILLIPTGYFLYESILMNPQTALGSVIPNMMQGVVGVIIFQVLRRVLPKNLLE